MSSGNTKAGLLSVKLKNLSKQELNERDVFGRTIIHIICILGRFDLLKYLLQNSNLNIYIVDYESGWTGLHHSIFYGKISCARLLLDHTRDLVKIKDRNGLTAIDIYHLKYSYQNLKIFPSSIGVNDTNYSLRNQEENDKSINRSIPNNIWWDRDLRGGSEVFTFGINVNNHLGTGDTDDKLKSPYKVDIKNLRLDDNTLSIADRLVKPRIKDIKISKNHSVILTNEEKGNILVSGNPSRGRLGHGSSLPNYKFTHLDYFADEHIAEVAISDEHTLALTSDGEVYSWGLNNYFELGYPTDIIKEKTDTFSNEPRRVVQSLKKLKIKGIACSKIHSAAYTDHSLVLWGLNVGQMDFVSTGETVKYGKLKGVVQVPRKLEFSNDIRQVITTDESTIVLLENSECHILTNGNHLRFQIPLFKKLNNEFEYFRPTRFSRKRNIIKLVSKNSAKIGILYDDGSVSNFGVDIFSKSSNIKYSPVWSPRNSHLKCHDVDIGQDGSIIICTRAGSVYKRISRTSGKSEYKFSKIEKVSKVVKVCCDSLFTSFGFIKDDVDLLPLDLAKNQFLMDINYLSPLTPSISNRRQSQLTDCDHSERFVANYLNKPHYHNSEEAETIKIFQNKFKIDEEEISISDPLFNNYINRWDKSQSIKDTFEKVPIIEIAEFLMRDDLKYQLNTNEFSDGKNYDLEFELDDCLIGIHKSILFFIPGFKNIFDSDLVIADIVFQKVNEENIIKVQNLHVQSLLILINLLYTGALVKIWDKYTASSYPPLVREIKDQTLQVLKKLGLMDELERSTYKLFDNFHNIDAFDNDVIIRLKDGEEIQCCSYILKARNAYFETLFSERWDGAKTMEFEHISKDVFEIALKYIYGYEQMQLMNDMDHLTNITDFINFQVEMIELSDELLLFGLKDLAQLNIKDFITQDNVLLILHHAESLNCNLLVGECLWFIYNNVELFLLDTHYEELLSPSLVKRIDSYFRWMNRVNKVKKSDEHNYWFDNDSGELLRKFLGDKKVFNSHFLAEDSFEPLFDLKPVKKETKPSPKLEPKKTRIPSPPPVIVSETEKKKSVSIDPLLSSSWSSRRSSQADSSSAIEFGDNEFQPVVNRRRRSSAKRTSNSQPSSTNSVLPTPSKTIPIPQTTVSNPVYRHRNSSTSSLKENIWPGMQGASASPNGISPMSNWATPSPASSTINGSGSPIFKSQWTDTPTRSTVSTSKVNFNSGSKLSQKERKKLLKSNEVETTPSKSKSSSPWNVVPPTKEPNTKKVETSSLLNAQAEAIAAEKRTPSLAGIIHEEEHRVLESVIKETERKSLAEVQQEEEFALWWEAESKKVQQQMNALNGNSNGVKSKSNKKKNFNSSKNRKRSAN